MTDSRALPDRSDSQDWPDDVAELGDAPTHDPCFVCGFPISTGNAS
jgi:hypothetical protein